MTVRWQPQTKCPNDNHQMGRMKPDKKNVHCALSTVLKGGGVGNRPDGRSSKLPNFGGLPQGPDWSCHFATTLQKALYAITGQGLLLSPGERR